MEAFVCLDRAHARFGETVVHKELKGNADSFAESLHGIRFLLPSGVDKTLAAAQSHGVRRRVWRLRGGSPLEADAAGHGGHTSRLPSRRSAR